MALRRLPFRDPRTVARDIPGVLDILFPRLSGGLVAALNKKMFSFDGVEPVSDGLIENCHMQKAMIFEIAVARAEFILKGDCEPSWKSCFDLASRRQRRHYDAKIPQHLEQVDIEVADRAAQNLVTMLTRVQGQSGNAQIELSPSIPGLGWIASGHGDFAIGSTLVEVKHTDRNFIAGDFRQVLIYWLLKYAAAIESGTSIWTDLLLLNPRRNSGLLIQFDYLLRSASANSNRIELFELLRSIVGQDVDRR